MLNKKLQSLLEELKGEVAKTDNEATKESAPEVYTVKLSNAEIFPAEDHEEKEEVKELIIEDKEYSVDELKSLFEELDLDTDKYTFNYLVEELGFELLEDEVTAKGDAAMTDNEATKETDGVASQPDSDNKDLFPEEAEEEVEEVIVEGYTREELQIVFEELNLDTKKYTFEYLAESLGFELLEDITSKGEVAKTDNEATKETEGTLLTPAKDNKDTFGAEDHEQKEEVDGIVVEDVVWSYIENKILGESEDLEEGLRQAYRRSRSRRNIKGSQKDLNRANDPETSSAKKAFYRKRSQQKATKSKDYDRKIQYTNVEPNYNKDKKISDFKKKTDKLYINNPKPTSSSTSNKSKPQNNVQNNIVKK